MRIAKVIGGSIATCVCLWALLPSPAASKGWLRRPNYSYVLSDADGDFYARGTPPADTGGKGVTKVYRVMADGTDKHVATYDWYVHPEGRPYGLHLCGNPDTGEVALLLHTMWFGRGNWKETADKNVLEFFRDGRHLASYSVADLATMGIEIKRIPETDSYEADYQLQ